MQKLRRTGAALAICQTFRVTQKGHVILPCDTAYLVMRKRETTSFSVMHTWFYLAWSIVAPITKGKRETGGNPRKLVPNQALYQAEPQPENDYYLL